MAENMWIEDYVHLLFPTNPNDIHMNEAQELKFRHIPNSLYRYRKFNDHNLENLISEQEWQSYPCEFNDPYDSRLKIDFNKINHELFFEKTLVEFQKDIGKRGISLSDEALKDIRSSDRPFYTIAKQIAKLDPDLQGKEEEFANVIFQITDNKLKELYEPIKTVYHTGYLVVCFSETKDSILMWSHYAKDHSGFCIEYNFKELDSDSTLKKIIEPVVYSDNLFDATLYFLEPILNGHNPNSLFGIYTAIRKASRWADEKEWRSVFPLGPGANIGQRFIKVPTPKALYVGAKANKNDVSKLKEIAKKKNIPLYQMVLGDDSFDLNIKTLYLPYRK